MALSDFAMKTTFLSEGEIIHQTELGLLIRFRYDNRFIEHWFPKLGSKFSGNEVEFVPTFVYEEAISPFKKKN